MLHPAHILAYAPADNYMNQHQNVAAIIAIVFLIGLAVILFRGMASFSKSK